MGGYDGVRRTLDWRKFRHDVNLYIGDCDAQMIVDKMKKRNIDVPGFSFEYRVHKSQLVSVFWADQTMKSDYQVFGDVVSFDATYTNKYELMFVQFAGIDHNQKCVTFGAALIPDETYKSYSWVLDAFLKVLRKQPPLLITDQEPALRKAIFKYFPDSCHKLCMWDIIQKLPRKVLYDLDEDSKFRKEFQKLIWNVYIEPIVFEERWIDLISRYKLGGNKWLRKMYGIRDRWIPVYFKDYPMSGLMKTTSRSESSNTSFQIFSHQGNTFVQFMSCFESAIEKQRYTRCVLDNTSNETIASLRTELPIEQHARHVYTLPIFREVQKEIHKGLYACKQQYLDDEGDVQNFEIIHEDKRHAIVVKTKVGYNKSDGSVTCSCGHYSRHGYLCCHIFCVLGNNHVDRIPNGYINIRWTKYSFPVQLIESRHRYDRCVEETEKIASQIHATFNASSC